MQTLDLNAYGVQAMSHQEMVETNGGILPLIIFGGKFLFKYKKTKAATSLVVKASFRGCS